MQTHPTHTGSARRRVRAVLAVLVPLALAACGAESRGGSPSEGEAAAAPGAVSSPQGQSTYAPGPPLARPPAAAPENAPPGSGGADAGTDIDALGFTRGSPDAPVQVVEFSDFGCGYCAQFHRETWPVLHRDYVETGRVQWKMVPFDVGMFPHARHAVLAGECAGEQGRFEDVRARLFEEQRAWKGGSAGEALALFRRMAGEEGLDTDRFNRCMAQGWRAPRVDASNALARELGVRGTPTFYVLGFGVVPGAVPAAEFAALLDRALAVRAGEQGP